MCSAFESNYVPVRVGELLFGDDCFFADSVSTAFCEGLAGGYAVRISHFSLLFVAMHKRPENENNSWGT